MRLRLRGIRVLRRDGNTHGSGRQAVRECASELVLRSDDCRGHSGLGHAPGIGRRGWNRMHWDKIARIMVMDGVVGSRGDPANASSVRRVWDRVRRAEGEGRRMILLLCRCSGGRAFRHQGR
jgi:hypothetical protein